ncbi:uncharacterized protein LOC130194232 [Pseudoliparis swirei]|uniref:uncharacterized protein LOC130194232 n=1 Tax=Pseudoliparis swirei TaxID=2059687 RepID=UPI0024BDF40E|nr:uncharacterized protein LOC130194232 [Pseudoliparis swirei]
MPVVQTSSWLYGQQHLFTCVSCWSGNGLGAASSRESNQRGRVQRLVHGDSLRFILRVRSQEPDFPVWKQGGICGPWIPDDGKIVTHTVSKAGKMSQKYWTSKVVLVHVGVTSVIAHIKMGHMHAALESKVLVVSAQVCGDDVCELEENCLNCPADCGICPMSITIKVAIGLPVALFSSGFILTIVWLQYQKRRMLWDESWIITYKSIIFGKVCCTGLCSTISLERVKSMSTISQTTDMTVSTRINTSFIQPGLYDGRTVAVKHIQNKHFSLSKTIRKEVKEVRQLDHPNLCKFIGGSIEVPYICIITEHCPKGSLSDVLLNEEVPINWGFRLSFATDITRGMSYLHQHRMFHGRLHSRNCVIDDRWVCKISGNKRNNTTSVCSVKAFWSLLYSCFQQSHICDKSLNILSLNNTMKTPHLLIIALLRSSFTSSNFVIKAK